MVGLRRRHLVAKLQPDASLALSATATLGPERHANRILLLTGDGSTLQTYTLPAATGSGNYYEFHVQTTNSGNYVIAAAGSDEFNGAATGFDSGAVEDSPNWNALAGDNFATFTFGNTNQGELMSWVKFTDVVSGVWSVQGLLVQSGTEATPFS